MTNALIVGAGPSLRGNLEDYKALGDFPGIVIATDAALKPMLEMDIIPDYCATLEDLGALTKYYTPKIVKEKGHLVKHCYLSDRVHPAVRKTILDAGMKSGVAAKCRDNTTSNVGLFSWLITHRIHEVDTTYLIGMDHCYADDKPPPVDQDSELFFYGFYTLISPHHGDKQIILNPAHELWREEFHWNMDQYPNIKVINSTGFGALFGDKIEWKPISQMTKWS